MTRQPSEEAIQVASLTTARTMDELRMAFRSLPRAKQEQYAPLKDLMKTIIEDTTP